jgi:hypothetical protein
MLARPALFISHPVVNQQSRFVLTESEMDELKKLKPTGTACVGRNGVAANAAI